MSYTRALAERRRALARCRKARGGLDAATAQMVHAYQAHPVTILAGAVGVGFLLAQLQVGTGLVRAGARIASGPAWGLVRQFLQA